MTKTQEKELLKTVEDLKKQVADLYKLLENTKIDKHVYTVAETAQILNITPQAVYAMIERGEIESVKLGRIKILGESLRNKLGVIKK